MLEFLDNYDDLTASERKVLTYLVEHTEEIPYMNINQLAEDAFVSKTIIINLSQKLGFSGFKELKYHINAKLRQRQQEKVTVQQPKKVLERIIDKTMSLVMEDEIKECASLLLNGRNIFIMARGTSKSVGYYLEHLLFSMGMHCFFIDDYNLSESFTRLVTEEDIVVLISLSGSTKKILETARAVHLKNAQIISLTSFQANQLADYAQYQLFCYTEEFDTKKDDAISRIGFFILVDMLVGELRNMIKE